MVNGQSTSSDDGQRSTLGALARVCLGAAVLLERQAREALTARPGAVSEAGAVVLGLADRTAGVARNLLDRAKHAVSSGDATDRAKHAVARPLREVLSTISERVDGLAARGHAMADSASGEAAEFLKGESDRAIAWARTTLIPPIVEDLANSDQIRELVFDQALGAVSDAGRTAKSVASDADALVEARFQRLLRRGEPVDD